MKNIKELSATKTDKSMRVPKLIHAAMKHVALKQGITMRELLLRVSIKTINTYNQDMEKLTRH